MRAGRRRWPRLLGVIGGLSPYSTIVYYKLLVEGYRARAGVDPRLAIYSVPVQAMCRLMSRGDLDGAASLLAAAAEALARAGATRLILAANTPHAALRRLGPRPAGLDYIDIVEPVADRLEDMGVRRVGLLATAATVKHRVYHDVLEGRGIEVITPPSHAQNALDEMVSRLTEGAMSDGDKLLLASLVNQLAAKGAQAVVYGCTELSLYAGHVHSRTPIIDSLEEHVKAAVEAMLAEDGQKISLRGE